MKGIKFDQDKVHMQLLPLDALYEAAKVMTFGANKYGPNDWKKVKHAKERYKGALLRHLTEDSKGNKYDPETGELHLAHMLCNAMFILWHDMKETKKKNDKNRR